MYLYISHPECKKHDNGWGHPENSQRVSVIEDQLIAQGLLDFMLQQDSRQATKEDITPVHGEHYWDVLQRNLPEEGLVHIDSDTALGPDSLSSALHAAGAVLDGIDALMENRVGGVFCNVRPPGHHAEISKPMGFCLFNNIAIGAAYALEKYGLERIAVLDFDVHHGNGTETYAEIEPRLSFISSYQKGIFPFPEDASPYENILKLPLPAGTDGDAFLKAWEEKAWPWLIEQKPQLILVSAGFDSHMADPIGGMKLREKDFALWAKSLHNTLLQIGNPKVLSVLEGGYDPLALALSASTYIKAMAQF